MFGASTRALLRLFAFVVIAACFVSKVPPVPAAPAEQSEPANTTAAYLGFDRNDYPGDDSLADLRTKFAYIGYWLNNPPGATQNTWAGKRRILLAQGFGFLVIFNGRLDKDIEASADPAKLGRADAAQAAQSASAEGFPKLTIIFLDVEEGGRMLPEQKAYIYAWVDGIHDAGFLAGVYCSGIPAPDGPGHSVITAEDLRQSAGSRKIVFWVAIDSCPPSPGCSFSRQPLSPGTSWAPFASVWQYAQSPRRPQLTRSCAKTYAQDGNCYVPGADSRVRLFVDLNVAREEDPSHGGAR
jgi:hypothetical protein